MDEKIIELGDKVQDKVSGFMGVVTARSEYLNGCVQFLLRPPIDKEGKMVDGSWFDENQLKIIKKNFIVVEKKQVGGPMDNPKVNLDSRKV